MLRRCWGLAILAIFAIALSPVFGQSSDYNKEAVQALSNRIDAHLATVWKKAGVTPAPKAGDYVFYRRLNLDLAGRVPGLVPIHDFIDNEAADKRWKEVDDLLKTPQHAQHFAHVWRSIMLTNQTNQQTQFLMPQFEAWIRERMQKNVALDTMVHQLLTSQQGNMGFNPGMTQGSPQLFFTANENKAENLAGASSRVFLGVKIECAQCHAHPFAKWTKEQFWEFAAFYSVQPQAIRRPGDQGVPKVQAIQPGREILIPGTEKVVKAKFLNGDEPKWDGLTSSRKTLADWITAKDNPYFAKAMADHVWSYLMGVSLLEPIMEPSDDSPVTHPDLLSDLAKALIDNNFDQRFLIRAIVHSDAYQRSSGGTKLADKEDYHLFVRMPIRALAPEQIYDSLVNIVVREKGEREMLLRPVPPQQFFNPNGAQSPRTQFMLKFPAQDRRHEPQTSILQALFMMNGGFMTKYTKLENNDDLKDLAGQDGPHEKRIRSLYMIVLSRPPRQNEIDRLVPYLEKGAANNNLGRALSDVYWALLNSSEFLLNH
ncbi:MAG: DUF1553 domain-containing protein [Planctomycetes bacterium]|nr:DUF1553 domain-containing protein [Planctomycetota bacterium]